MKIDTTPDFLEMVANHPRVYPYVSVKGCGPIKLAPIWKDCIAVVFDTGGWLFHRQEPDVYDVHTLFLPKSKHILERATVAKDYIFREAGAELLTTMVAEDMPHVRRLTLACGFEWVCKKFGEWERDSGSSNYDHYQLTRESWASGEH